MIAETAPVRTANGDRCETTAVRVPTGRLAQCAAVMEIAPMDKDAMAIAIRIACANVHATAGWIGTKPEWGMTAAPGGMAMAIGFANIAVDRIARVRAGLPGIAVATGRCGGMVDAATRSGSRRVDHAAMRTAWLPVTDAITWVWAWAVIRVWAGATAPNALVITPSGMSLADVGSRILPAMRMLAVDAKTESVRAGTAKIARVIVPCIAVTVSPPVRIAAVNRPNRVAGSRACPASSELTNVAVRLT